MTKKKNTNRDLAVALRYKQAMDTAPRVIAKGQGLVAQTIIQTAEKHGVPVRRDNDLVNLLAEVELDREIPAELYAAVAEVLSWIYRANTDLKSQIST